jgi:uncharacterized protein (TIGR02996 family)
MIPGSEKFLAAVRSNPADDLPRLVFADWLDEHNQCDHAEFIRGQIQLHGMNPWDIGYTALDIRCRGLLRRNAEAWLGDWANFGQLAYIEDSDWPTFERGFPTRLTISYETLKSKTDRLCRGGALTGIRLTEPRAVLGWGFEDEWQRGDLLAYLGSQPRGWPRSMSALALTGSDSLVVSGPRLQELVVRAPEEAYGYRSRLRWWTEFCQQPFVSQLERLTIVGTPYDRAPIHGLERLTGLRRLCLNRWFDYLPTDRAFEALTHLRLDTLEPIGWLVVMRMANLQSVAIGPPSSGWMPRLPEPSTFWREVSILGPRAADPMLRSPAASMMTVLDASGGMGGLVLTHLANHPAAEGLRILKLNTPGHQLPHPNQWPNLPALERLEIGGQDHLDKRTPSLIPRVLNARHYPHLIALRLGVLRDVDVQELAQNEQADRLRELTIDGPLSKAFAKSLAACPHLQNLELLTVTPGEKPVPDILRDRFGRRVKFVE